MRSIFKHQDIDERPSIIFNFVFKEKESLKNEAKMLKDLNHANVVKYYDALNKPDGIYIFLEYVTKVNRSIT